MKKLFLIGAMLTASFTLTYAQNTATVTKTVTSTTASATVNDPNKGEFKFEKEVYDFGTVAEGPAAAYEFKFSNTGNEPLIITNVVASCGCTTPKWSKDPVAKGKGGAIMDSYDTNGRIGPFTKAVTISSNAKTPTKVLYIKGTVEKK